MARRQYRGYGRRILDSFVAMLFGIGLFFGSFVVLFINEGRENLAEVATLAEQFEVGEQYDGNALVYRVGTLETTSPATDAYLQNDDFIYLVRSVEFYGYIETEHRRTEEHIGGGETTIITYSYERGWTSNPTPRAQYKGDSTEIPTDLPAEYDTYIANMPQARIDTATALTIDGVLVRNNHLTISNPSDFVVTNESVEAAALEANESVENGAIFRQNSSAGSLNNPGLGDIRLTYQVVTSNDEGVLIGSIADGGFARYITPEDNTLYRFFTGSSSLTEVISILQAEYTTMLWILRIVGFLMMFIGLILIARPIRTVLAVVPIFAKIGGFVYGVVAFIVALVLTFITIIIATIFHNAFLAISVSILLAVGAFIYLKRKQKTKLEASSGYNG